MEHKYIDTIYPFLEELKPLDAIPTGAKENLVPCKVKAVIFDIYGTLMISASGDIDQADYNADMIRKAFKAVNIELLEDRDTTIDKIHSTFNANIKAHKAKGKKEGRPFPEVNILKVWQDTLDYFEAQGIVKCPATVDLKMLTFVFELQTNKVWPMPGMEEVIKKLGDSDLELGIISNAQFYTPVIMNYFLYNKAIGGRVIAPFKDEISVYSFEELRLKPDVTLFEIILKELEKKGIRAEETAFIGNDMLKDIWAAHEAGLKTIFFAGDKRAYRLHEGDVRTDGLTPDHTITSLPQLLEILDV